MAAVGARPRRRVGRPDNGASLHATQAESLRADEHGDGQSRATVFARTLRLLPRKRLLRPLPLREHVATEHIAPEDVVIRQEVAVRPVRVRGHPGHAEGQGALLRGGRLRLHTGAADREPAAQVQRGRTTRPLRRSKVVLVIDVNGRKDWSGSRQRAERPRPDLALESLGRTPSRRAGPSTVR